MSPRLPFTGPWLLAPMDGVTDSSFRELVISRHEPSELGGTFTEFARVTEHALPVKLLRKKLGARSVIPVGLQIMGSDVASVAETARRAEEAGAPVVDLNFGCPARGALRTCAGSALLAEPRRMEELVRACVDAVEEVPVTAKIRAGVDADDGVEDLARAVEAGGAALLTIHCRTRHEGYRDEAVDWDRIRRAVDSVDIPVCGNGGVTHHGDLERMRRETGCRHVMIGRGALADPWIFTGCSVSRAEAAAFLVDYAERMLTTGAALAAVASRLKQLLRYWTAGGLVGDDRVSWLREAEPERLVERLRRAAGSLATAPAEEA